MTIGKLSGQCDFGQKGQSYCNQRGQSCVAKRVKVAWLFHVGKERIFTHYPPERCIPQQVGMEHKQVAIWLELHAVIFRTEHLSGRDKYQCA